MTIGENVKRIREDRGMSQDELAAAAKTTQSTIDRIERDLVQNSRFLPRIAGVLRVPLAELDESYAATPLGSAASAPAIPGSALMGERDWPIHASAEGGQGQIIISSDPVDYMPRPAPVANVRGAYGLYITGDSMIPEFEPGDVAIVNPHLPVVPDTTCIFYAEIDGGARATIKRLRRAAQELWHVKQWNPPDGMKAEFTLARREWTTAHRTLGKYSRR